MDVLGRLMQALGHGAVLLQRAEGVSTVGCDGSLIKGTSKVMEVQYRRGCACGLKREASW